MPRKRKNYDFTEVDDTSRIEEEIFMPSTLETIDFSVKKWLDEELNIFSNTNKGWKKVPIVWVSPERAAYRKRRQIRDEFGNVILPAISYERTSIDKDPKKRGSIYSLVQNIHDTQGGKINIARRIKQDKTSNYARADTYKKNNKRHDPNHPRKNNKVVYQTITIPVPMYMELTYTISIHTEYQEQMNDIMASFITYPGANNSLLLKYDGHMYEAFLGNDYKIDNNVSKLEQEERKYRTDIDLRVIGYIIGADKNQNQPKIVKRENAVQIYIPRERVITDVKNEILGKKGFYRE